ncbi:MAG: peptide ABC transporter substrate-binding protein [Vulcanimicrobiaceae bacterium]
MKLLKAASLVLSAILAASCTRVETSAPGTGRHGWTVPHVLRIAETAEPDHFNPLLSTMDLVYMLDSLVFSFLIVADDKGRLIGDLATEVPSTGNGGISKDGRTYTYHLHRGVKWHDGALLTSRDVRFTISAVLNPNNNTLHREGYDRIAKVETPDDYTVVVRLKERYPPFLTKFFAPLQEGGKGILPEHLLGKLHDINNVPFNSHPVGSGPFKFVSWERGHQIVLARNDAYFKGRPKLETIKYEFLPDDNVIFNAVKTHDIDLVTAPPLNLYDQYRSIPDVAVYLVPWNAQSILILNGRHPGLNDVNVRKAITMAIDYQSVIAKITHNVGTIAHDIVPQVALGYTDNPPYRFDPAGANALLDRSGWMPGADGVRAKGGARLDFVADISAGSAIGKALAAYFQQEFKAIGVNLSIKLYPYSIIFSHDGPVYTGKYDFAQYSTTLPYDPDNLFYVGCNYWFPAGENLYGYCDRRVDAGEMAGVKTDDLAERARIYHATEAQIHETIPWIPLYNVRRAVVRNLDLKNFSDNPSSTPWWNAWQWDI